MVKTKKLTALALIALLFAALAISATLGAVTARAEELTEIRGSAFVRDATDVNVVVGVNIPQSASVNVKLVLPEGVTAIGVGAFQNVNNENGKSRIAAVELPDTLVSIGNYAFAQTAIAEIKIPSSVTTVGEHAFHGCTYLADVTFAERNDDLTLGIFAFAECTMLKTVNIPDNTVICQYAFFGCRSLLWAYLGNHCRFNNTAKDGSEFFFPVGTQLTVVFPHVEAYNEMMNRADTTFKDKHGSASTYVVNVNYYVGSTTTPVVYERLHGRNYNFVKDDLGNWNVDTSYSALYVQHSGYASTAWYADRDFTTAVGYDKVNEMLSGNAAKIDLYCHETVFAPTFPNKPASWMFDNKVSYDIADKAQVLQALGCTDTFTEAQRNAMDFSVIYSNDNGEVVETPKAISGSGVYRVAITLDPAYGSWAQNVNQSLTITVNTSGFNTILIVLAVLGGAGIAATVSTAVIRKVTNDRNKRKQISQKEVLEKFKAIGGESPLIK